MASASRSRRVLLALLVYNGREFVPRCLESARRVVKNSPGVDVLVLDDCSPEAGWSEELEDLCHSLRLGYYRSPRNLGIPRNMNLGLLRAHSAGYDHVVILNSDVILPYNLVDALVGVAEENAPVASVTAWSNSCTIYSLKNDHADEHLADQETVDWISDTLGGEFGPAGVDIPAAVGFCMLIPVPAISEVGLFDPLFGRGYCEELDWCLRAKALGFRNLLAPNVFVYHEGGGSTREAGLLIGRETTVWAHERIIDQRYPLFREQVDAFGSSDIPDRMKGDGLRRLVVVAAEQQGYDVEASWLPAGHGDPRSVRFVVPADPSDGVVRGHYRGFRARFRFPPGKPVLKAIEAVVGRKARKVLVYGHDPAINHVRREAAESGTPLIDRPLYPERI